MNKEIRIYTDSGRSLRPLFVVESSRLKITKQDIRDKKKKKMKFDDLVDKGVMI